MTTSPAIKKSKSTATKPATIKSTDQEDAILKCSSCHTLSRTGTIGYEISTTDSGEIEICLTSNSNKGYFSRTKVNFKKTMALMKEFEKKQPLTSLALKDAYPPNTSINCRSFLMSVLLAEGLVEAHPDHPRRYRLCKDPDAFLASLDKLKMSHTKTSKPNAKVKTKAVGSMSKGKTKAAAAE